MAAAGLGYGILPRMAMSGRGAHPGPKISRLDPRMHRTLVLVIRRDKPVNEALRVVLDAVVAAGRKAGPLTRPKQPAPHRRARGPACRR